MQNKVPPQNVEAEQAVLCAMIIDPACRKEARKSLTSKDFYRESHEIIFNALIQGNGDLTIIASELQSKGLLEKCGDRQYLAQLANVHSTPSALSHYVEIVKKLSIRRQIIEQCQFTAKKAFQQWDGNEELLSEHRKGLNAIDIPCLHGYHAGVDISNVYAAEKCLQEYSEYIKTLKQNRFITGIHEIDQRIRGVAGGEVLFIIARAGGFKTAMLQNLLKAYVNHSSWLAIFFSIEMPRRPTIPDYELSYGLCV